MSGDQTCPTPTPTSKSLILWLRMICLLDSSDATEPPVVSSELSPAFTRLARIYGKFVPKSLRSMYYSRSSRFQ